MRQLKGHKFPVRCVAYSPDGGFLASGDEDGTLRFWSLPSGDLVQEIAVCSGDSIEALAFSPPGDALAIVTDSAVLQIAPAIVTDSSVPAIRVGCYPHTEVAEVYGDHMEGGARALAWHPTQRSLLVVGTWSSRLLFVTSPGARPSRSQSSFWSQHHEPLVLPEPITSLAFTQPPEGANTLVLVGSSGLVRGLDATTRQTRWEHNKPRGSYALACSPDGKRLATGETNGDIILWNLADGSQVQKMTGHTWTIYGLAFTPDGQRLVSGSADGTVRLWDVPTGQTQETYRWHNKWVTSVAISPDGMTAAASSADHTIVVWDLADG
jgi:WD40 repeat protein